MNFLQMECFLELSKTLNPVDAAANLGINYDMLIAQIKSLEDAAGADLFIKNEPALRLTTSGEILKKDALQMASQLTGTVQRIRRMNTVRRTVVVGTYIGGYNDENIYSLIGYLKNQYQEHHIIIRHYNFDQLEEALLADTADIVISLPFKNLKKYDLNQKQISSRKGALFYGKNSRWNKENLQISDFSNSKFITTNSYEKNIDTDDLNVIGELGLTGVTIEDKSNVFDVLLSIEMGEGFGILDERFLNNRPNICRMDLPEQYQMPLYCYWKKGKTKCLERLAESIRVWHQEM